MVAVKSVKQARLGSPSHHDWRERMICFPKDHYCSFSSTRSFSGAITCLIRTGCP